MTTYQDTWPPVARQPTTAWNQRKVDETSRLWKFGIFEIQDFKWLRKLFGVVVNFGTTQIWKKMGNMKMIVVFLFQRKSGWRDTKSQKTGGSPSLLVMLKTPPKGQQPRFPGGKKNNESACQRSGGFTPVEDPKKLIEVGNGYIPHTT